MKIKTLIEQLQEIVAEQPDATIGILILSPVVTIADIDCITEQPEGSQPNYSIQPA